MEHRESIAMQRMWGVRNLRDVIERRGEYALGLLLFFVASVAAVILYSMDNHVFLYFGDAASHIVKARQIIDSWNPGIENIGTVWLPLPYFILLPFVAIDALFFSGIAGPVVGIPCLVGTGVLLFSIVRRLTASRSVSFLIACMFGLNPNVVYMSLTPMNEPSLFFFVTLGGYALLRWLQEDRARWLLLCAAAVMLASLCRYEAWILVGFVSLVAGLKGISFWRKAARSTAVRMFAIAGLSAAGIVLWLCWNRFEYGDALQFAPWKYRVTPSVFHNPLDYRQEAALWTYVRAVLNVFGPVVLLVGIAGVVRLLRRGAERCHALLFVFFSLPALFIFGGILTNLVLIDAWTLNWRFVLTLGLFLSAAGGIGLAGFFSSVRSSLVRGVAVFCCLAMPIIQMVIPSVGVATFRDAERIFRAATLDATLFGEQLHSTYRGGSIVMLTGYGLGERIMVSSWIPLKNFRVIHYPGGQDILGPIRSSDRYVVIGKLRMPESREVVDYWLSRRETFLRYYNVLLEDSHYMLLERTS